MNVCGCSACENCVDWLDEEPMYCSACGAELDHSDYVYVVKDQNEVVGCEHCITTAYAEEIEN